MFVTMTSLPNELLIIIFEYLKVGDLIQCSSVCKRFKLLCQGVTLPELIISNTVENIKDFWFYTHKQFNLQDAISVTTFNLHRSIFRLDKFRRLYFEGSRSALAQLKVDDLTQLEQVQINVEAVVGDKHEIHINLPNLKVMRIETSAHEFFVTAPKLEMLRCSDFDVVHLTNPDTVKHFETRGFNGTVHALKNVEFLLFTYLCSGFDLSNIVSTFPKLTKLFCNKSIVSIRREIKSLVKQERMHRRFIPKIYFLYVEMDDVIKQIREYLSHRDEFLFQIRHYSSLAETAFPVHGINYSEVMEVMNGKIPDDFHTKFFSTRCVYVKKKVENQEHLFGFLKHFDYLSTLMVMCDSLDQSFYNRVSEFDQLTSLVVEINNSASRRSLSLKSSLNFDFLLRMKRLNNFYTNIDSPMFCDLTLELFRLLKNFSIITFFFEGKAVMIGLNKTSNDYEFRYNRYQACRLDFNELVCEVNAIRSRHIN